VDCLLLLSTLKHSFTCTRECHKQQCSTSQLKKTIGLSKCSFGTLYNESCVFNSSTLCACLMTKVLACLHAHVNIICCDTATITVPPVVCMCVHLTLVAYMAIMSCILSCSYLTDHAAAAATAVIQQ
jgi:hypothetical protein